MVEQGMIEQCAAVCDTVAEELRVQKTTTPKKQYDRQLARRYDFAIRALHRARDRIRELGGGAAPVITPCDEKLAKALAFAQEMRPVILSAKHTAWRQEKLAQLDDLLR